MITILNISDTKFSYNGIAYFKNFTPFVTGNKVSIVNTYDACISLTNFPTIYSDISVDGVTYGSVAALQNALLPVLFNRTFTQAGSLAIGFIPKSNGSNSLGNSVIYENGSGNIGIGTTLPSERLHSAYNIASGASGFGDGSFLLKRASDGLSVANFSINTTSSLAKLSTAYSFLTFETEGVERARFVQGNVGIGTTSPSSPLTIKTSSSYLSQDIIGDSTNGWTSMRFRNSSNSATTVYFNYDNNEFKLGTTGSEPITFNTTNVPRLRITPSGNVGIGTTLPSAKLHLESSTSDLLRMKRGSADYIFQLAGTDLYLLNNATTTYALSVLNSGNVGIGTTIPGVKFVNSGSPFSSGPTLGSSIVGSQALLSNNGFYGLYSGVSLNGDVWHQVQRNDGIALAYNLALQPSGGNIYIGTNAPIYGTSAKMQFLFNGLNEFGMNFRTTAVNSIPLHFLNSTGSQIGYIFTDATSVSYASVSDYRLKEDLNSFNGLDLISKINVYDYKWKDQDKRSFGVMAHELQEVIPQAAFGEKDGERMQGVDYSALVPILVQAIKELKTEINTLKN